jgi:hypothetical protein
MEEGHGRCTEILPRSIAGADVGTNEVGMREFKASKPGLSSAPGSAVLRLALATTGRCMFDLVILAMVGHMTVEEE